MARCIPLLTAFFHIFCHPFVILGRLPWNVIQDGISGWIVFFSCSIHPKRSDISSGTIRAGGAMKILLSPSAPLRKSPDSSTVYFVMIPWNFFRSLRLYGSISSGYSFSDEVLPPYSGSHWSPLFFWNRGDIHQHLIRNMKERLINWHAWSSWSKLTYYLAYYLGVYSIPQISMKRKATNSPNTSPPVWQAAPRHAARRFPALP